MTYIPNSIERCTPIVGYDPYAYIMDKPSNLHIQKMRSPYDIDYFSKEGVNASQTSQKQNKKGINFCKIVKFIVGAGAIGFGIFGIFKGVNAAKAKKAAEGVEKTGILKRIKGGLKKLSDKIHTKNAPSENINENSGKFTNNVKSKLHSAGEFLGEKLSSGKEKLKEGAGFIGTKFNDLKDFVKSKFHK